MKKLLFHELNHIKNNENPQNANYEKPLIHSMDSRTDLSKYSEEELRASADALQRSIADISLTLLNIRKKSIVVKI